MIITVFGATGMVGKYIVSMGLAKGYHIRAFSRNIEKLIDKSLASKNFSAIQGHVFDEPDVYKAINGCDAVFSALGGGTSVEDKTRSLGMKNIITQMDRAGVKRIICVGSIAILKNDAHEYVMNKPGYPLAFLTAGNEHLQAYLSLKNSDLDWTIICPPEIKNEYATRKYVTSEEYPPFPNNYVITAGDVADFMYKSFEEKSYLHCRVGISN